MLCTHLLPKITLLALTGFDSSGQAQGLAPCCLIPIGQRHSFEQRQLFYETVFGHTTTEGVEANFLTGDVISKLVKFHQADNL
jgi:hypothetical protein